VLLYSIIMLSVIEVGSMAVDSALCSRARRSDGRSGRDGRCALENVRAVTRVARPGRAIALAAWHPGERLDAESSRRRPCRWHLERHDSELTAHGNGDQCVPGQR